MDEKIAKSWVKALRSGKYKQGKGHLCRNRKYCCLGVLSDLAYKKKIVAKELRLHDMGYKVCYYGDAASSLPKEVKNWADMFSDLGGMRHFTASNHLAFMNDVENKSFDEIADHIEKNWKNL